MHGVKVPDAGSIKHGAANGDGSGRPSEKDPKSFSNVVDHEANGVQPSVAADSKEQEGDEACTEAEGFAMRRSIAFKSKGPHTAQARGHSKCLDPVFSAL